MLDTTAVIATRPIAAAGTTVVVASEDVGVLRGHRVPMLAAVLVHEWAAQHVRAVRHRLEAGRVEARAAAAQMVEFEPIWNGTDERLVGDEMDWSLSHRVGRDGDRYSSVSVAVQLASPDPAVAFDSPTAFEALQQGRHWSAVCRSRTTE